MNYSWTKNLATKKYWRILGVFLQLATFLVTNITCPTVLKKTTVERGGRDCTNCGNTTEATTLLQQFIKKKRSKKGPPPWRGWRGDNDCVLFNDFFFSPWKLVSGSKS